MTTRKKIWLILSFVVLQSSFDCFGQITFTKGYIVDNNNKHINCLIKNNDWQHNPTKIQYRLNDSSEVITRTIDSIKEFQIDNFSRYLRATVKIDRSTLSLSGYSLTKLPEWSEESLFLRELVCGKAGLWSFSDTEKTWFFYNIDNSLPEQLVYKEYSANGLVGENNTFRQQLNVYVQNEYTKKIDVRYIKYSEKELLNYFKTYNKSAEYCSRTDFKRPAREIVNIKAIASLDYSILKIYLDNTQFDLGGKVNWKGGIELEYFLPFNRNTWSITFNPTYERFIYNKSTTRYSFVANCHSFIFPIGFRYSYYLKNNARIYANIFYNSALSVDINNLVKADFNIPVGNQWLYWVNLPPIKTSQGNSLIYGLGFTQKNIGVELKYYGNRDLFANYSSIYSAYSKLSLSISYKLFKFMGK